MPKVEKAIVALAIDQPALGQVRVSNELRKRGLLISPAGVCGVWQCHGLALLHESNVARNDPDLAVGHRLIAYDAGLPKSLIRFSTLHARTASATCLLNSARESPLR